MENRPFLLDSDSSAHQIVVTILHQQDEDNRKAWEKNDYWYRSLTDMKRRYIASGRECLSVVWAILTLQTHIEWTHITICFAGCWISKTPPYDRCVVASAFTVLLLDRSQPRNKTPSPLRFVQSLPRQRTRLPFLRRRDPKFRSATVLAVRTRNGRLSNNAPTHPSTEFQWRWSCWSIRRRKQPLLITILCARRFRSLQSRWIGVRHQP